MEGAAEPNVSTDGNAPHPDFALNGSIVFRLSTARGLATSFSLASFCALVILKPRSSRSASSCLCLRTARMRSSTRAARRPRITTPIALTMAITAVVLSDPLASARDRTFAIALAMLRY